MCWKSEPLFLILLITIQVCNIKSFLGGWEHIVGLTLLSPVGSLTWSFQFYKFLVTVWSIGRNGARLTLLLLLNRGNSTVFWSLIDYYMCPFSLGKTLLIALILEKIITSLKQKPIFKYSPAEIMVVFLHFPRHVCLIILSFLQICCYFSVLGYQICGILKILQG